MRQLRANPAGSGNGQHSLGAELSHCELPPGTLRHLEGSLKRQWKCYRKGLKRCQKKFSEDAVHESRVASRRLLSVVELLGPFLSAGRARQIQAALKRYLDTFDDLRDTQVQLPAVGKLLRAFPAACRFHDYLLKREKRFTRKTRKAIKRIKTKRLGQHIAAAREQVKEWRRNTQPAAANALLSQTMQSAFSRTRELHAQIHPKDTKTIHCTRVAFKKFRYMVETLAKDLPGVDAKRLATLHHYQTLMGGVQDAQVLLQTFDKFQCKGGLEPGPARQFRAELMRRRQKLIGTYLAAADQLLNFWPGRGALAGAGGSGAGRAWARGRPRKQAENRGRGRNEAHRRSWAMGQSPAPSVAGTAGPREKGQRR